MKKKKEEITQLKVLTSHLLSNDQFLSHYTTPSSSSSHHIIVFVFFLTLGFLLTSIVGTLCLSLFHWFHPLTVVELMFRNFIAHILSLYHYRLFIVLHLHLLGYGLP